MAQRSTRALECGPGRRPCKGRAEAAGKEKRRRGRGDESPRCCFDSFFFLPSFSRSNEHESAPLSSTSRAYSRFLWNAHLCKGPFLHYNDIGDLRNVQIQHRKKVHTHAWISSAVPLAAVQMACTPHSYQSWSPCAKWDVCAVRAHTCLKYCACVASDISIASW